MTSVQGHDDDRGEESQHVRPSGWKAAWEQAQDALAPSAEIKKAAETLVWCELLQQSMGWLLLTQIGVVLGSFGQVMSQGVCLLSWGIFTLEAVLKYGRSWAHNHYFRDVPCAYVALHDHQEAAHNSLAVFGLFVLSATLLEVALYVPYIYSVIRFYHFNHKCYDEEGNCPDGTTRLIEMLVISVIITCLHWIASLGTVLAFKAAMGMGITALTQRKDNSERQKLQNWKSFGRFSTKRTPPERVLCLTWWVHMARHRHLSALVASAQPDDCGLPGHWFVSVRELKRYVEAGEDGDHVHLDPAGPLRVSQEMSLRALVSLAKQANAKQSIKENCTEILSDDGFLLLVRVVREGKRETCRGLAAAAIAVLATQSIILEEQHVDLKTAVVPLKRLARSSNVEHIEVAYGALLNASLSDRTGDVISTILTNDESGGKFMSGLISHAHMSHTTRCQELAVGLLSCLVGSRKGKPARTSLCAYRDKEGGVNGLQLCTALVQHGLTAQIQAGAAGVLAEVAYWKDGQGLGNKPDSEDYGCIPALVDALQREPTIAFAAAKALCSLAFNRQENKLKIVGAGGIKHLVNLLRDHSASSTHNRASFGTRILPSFQRLPTGISLKKADGDDVNLSLNTQRAQLKERVRSDAARALRFLALNNLQHQEKIAREGAIPLLIDLLSSSDPKVHVQAIPALAALAYKNRTNQNLIGEYGGGRFFSLLMHVLKTSDEHEDMAEVISEKVSAVTKILTDGNESNRQHFLNSNIKQRLEECIDNKSQLFKNGKTIQNARQALESLDKEQEQITNNESVPLTNASSSGT